MHQIKTLEDLEEHPNWVVFYGPQPEKGVLSYGTYGGAPFI